MISKLTYVSCDRCGNPSEPIVGTAKDARRVARAVDGFACDGNEDVCKVCRLAAREADTTASKGTDGG